MLNLVTQDNIITPDGHMPTPSRTDAYKAVKADFFSRANIQAGFESSVVGSIMNQRAIKEGITEDPTWVPTNEMIDAEVGDLSETQREALLESKSREHFERIKAYHTQLNYDDNVIANNGGGLASMLTFALAEGYLPAVGISKLIPKLAVAVNMSKTTKFLTAGGLNAGLNVGMGVAETSLQDKEYTAERFAIDMTTGLVLGGFFDGVDLSTQRKMQQSISEHARKAGKTLGFKDKDTIKASVDELEGTIPARNADEATVAPGTTTDASKAPSVSPEVAANYAEPFVFPVRSRVTLNADVPGGDAGLLSSLKSGPEFTGNSALADALGVAKSKQADTTLQVEAQKEVTLDGMAARAGDALAQAKADKAVKEGFAKDYGVAPARVGPDGPMASQDVPQSLRKFIPASLHAMKPTMEVDGKVVSLVFQSDIDKALVAVSDKLPGKNSKEVMKFLQKVFPGLSPEELRASGKTLRESYVNRGKPTKKGIITVKPLWKNAVDPYGSKGTPWANEGGTPAGETQAVNAETTDAAIETPQVQAETPKVTHSEYAHKTAAQFVTNHTMKSNFKFWRGTNEGASVMASVDARLAKEGKDISTLSKEEIQQMVAQEVDAREAHLKFLKELPEEPVVAVEEVPIVVGKAHEAAPVSAQDKADPFVDISEGGDFFSLKYIGPSEILPGAHSFEGPSGKTYTSYIKEDVLNKSVYTDGITPVAGESYMGAMSRSKDGSISIGALMKAEPLMSPADVSGAWGEQLLNAAPKRQPKAKGTSGDTRINPRPGMEPIAAVIDEAPVVATKASVMEPIAVQAGPNADAIAIRTQKLVKGGYKTGFQGFSKTLEGSTFLRTLKKPVSEMTEEEVSNALEAFLRRNADNTVTPEAAVAIAKEQKRVAAVEAKAKKALEVEEATGLDTSDIDDVILDEDGLPKGQAGYAVPAMMLTLAGGAVLTLGMSEVAQAANGGADPGGLGAALASGILAVVAGKRLKSAKTGAGNGKVVPHVPSQVDMDGQLAEVNRTLKDPAGNPVKASWLFKTDGGMVAFRVPFTKKEVRMPGTYMSSYAVQGLNSAVEEVKQLSSVIFNNNKGTVGRTAVQLSADVIQHQTISKSTGMIMREYAPAFKAWADEKGLGKMSRAMAVKHGREFNIEVTHAIRNPEGADPHVLAVAQSVSGMREDLLKTLNHISEGRLEFAPDSLMGRALQLVNDPNFAPRVYAFEAIDAIHALLGKGKNLAPLFAGAIKAARPAMTQEAADKVAEGVMRTLSRIRDTDGAHLTMVNPATMRVKLIGEGLDEDTVDIVMGLVGHQQGGVPSHMRSRMNLDESFSMEFALADGSTKEIKFSDILENDVMAIHQQWVHNLSGIASLYQAGKRLGADFTSDVEWATALRKAEDAGASRDEIALLDDSREYIMGRGGPTDHFGRTSKFGHAARALVTLTSGSDFVWAQLADIGNALGPKAALKMMRNYPQFRHAVERMGDNPTLMQKFAATDGSGFEHLGVASRSYGTMTHESVLTESVDRAVNLGFKANGFFLVNDILRSSKKADVLQEIMNHTRGLQEIPEGSFKHMAVFGIDKGVLEELSPFLNRHVKVDEHGVVLDYDMDAMMADDVNLAFTFSSYLTKVGKDATSEAVGIGHMSKFSQTELGKFLMQFSKTSLVGSERMVRDGYNFDSEVLLRWGTSFWFAAMSHVARSYLNFGQDKEELKKRLSYEEIGKAAFRNSAFAGIAPNLVDLGAKVLGQEALFAASTTSGRQGGAQVPVQFGLERLVTTTGTIASGLTGGSTTQSEAYNAAKTLLPIWYVKPAMQFLSSGLPNKRPQEPKEAQASLID